jgi:hypothetical protein
MVRHLPVALASVMYLLRVKDAFQAYGFQDMYDDLSLDWVEPGGEFLQELFEDMGIRPAKVSVHGSDCWVMVT